MSMLENFIKKLLLLRLNTVANFKLSLFGKTFLRQFEYFHVFCPKNNWPTDIWPTEI